MVLICWSKFVQVLFQFFHVSMFLAKKLAKKPCLTVVCACRLSTYPVQPCKTFNHVRCCPFALVYNVWLTHSTPVKLELDAELELDDFNNSRYCCYIEDISTSNLFWRQLAMKYTTSTHFHHILWECFLVLVGNEKSSNSNSCLILVPVVYCT